MADSLEGGGQRADNIGEAASFRIGRHFSSNNRDFHLAANP